MLWGAISGCRGACDGRLAESLLLLDVVCKVTQRLGSRQSDVDSLCQMESHTDSPALRSCAVCGCLYRSALVAILVFV